MNIQCSIILLLSLFILPLCAQDVSKLDDQFRNEPAFRHAQLGYAIKKISNSKEVIGLNQKVKMIPASSLKLITTLSAVKLLGKDYTYKTKLYHTGTLNYDGTLEGDILIVASGDPTLASPAFKGVKSLPQLIDEITNKIRKAGINCIEGSIKVDNSIFEHEGPEDGWQFNDIANYYGAGAWSFNIHENLFSICFDTNDKIGKVANVVSTDPQMEDLIFDNKVRIAGSYTGDNAYVYGSVHGAKREIRGTVPQTKGSFRIKAALPNPSAFFCRLLHDNLLNNDISIHNELISSVSKKLISDIPSPPLERIAYMCNKESNNLYAESLLKTVAVNNNLTGNAKNGIKQIIKLLESYKIDKNQIDIKDGSGLSRSNYISPESMASFLSAISKDLGSQFIRKLISQPGEKGTLQNIMKGKSNMNKFWIKTGSMGNIQTYSGYMEGKSGELYSFCLMCNGSSASNSSIRRAFDTYLSEMQAAL